MSCLYILCPCTKMDHPQPDPLPGEREFFAYSLGFAKPSERAHDGPLSPWDISQQALCLVETVYC